MFSTGASTCCRLWHGVEESARNENPCESLFVSLTISRRASARETKKSEFNLTDKSAADCG